MPRGRKKAAPVETETVKATEVVSVEETVEEEKTAVSAEEPAQEVPKKRGRKPGAKNKPKEVKKEVKEMKTTKTSTGKGLTENIYVEYGDGQYRIEDITNRIKEAWTAEGHRVGSIKNLDIYIKPEHNKAYYVINDKNGGSVDL